MSLTLSHNDFQRGMVRDDAQVGDRIRAMRTIKNYRYEYGDDEVRLKIRKGYDRYNAIALANPADQLFWFEDSSGNTHLLGIYDDKWYRISETGAHLNLGTHASTPRRPIVQVGDRVFYGTDAGMRWTDHNAISGSPKSYRWGIVPPAGVPLVATTTSEGNIGSYTAPTNTQQEGAAAIGLRLITTSHQKLAMVYTPSSDQTIRNIVLYMMPYYVSGRAGIKVSIYTGASEPTTLLSTDAVSDWVEITAYTSDEYEFVDFVFQDDITLISGTKYWVVIEYDDAYEANFSSPLLGGDHFYVAFAYTSAAPAGDSLRYNGSWVNESYDHMALFMAGGLNPSHHYDYKLTFYNDTYKHESRPGAVSTRISPTSGENRVLVSTPSTLDGQVDYVGVYRRDIGTDGSLAESQITTNFLWTGKVTVGNVYTDYKTNDQLGAELQSDDNYEHDAYGDEGSGERTAGLIPEVVTYWKGRIIFAEADSNILHFTKRLEADGAMGQVGNSDHDCIPLANRQEMPVPSPIIGLKPLAQDQLAVYFKDETVWIIRGMNEVLNPPSDIGRRPMLTTLGLFAPASVQDVKGRHAYVSSDGVQVFNGTPNPEHISAPIQSIFDAIESAYLDDSIIAVFGDEIWILVDDDNDGNKESIYIIDLQRAGGIWRIYDYGTSLNDLIPRRTGNTFRTLLAADAESNYVLELETGTDDNGSDIDAMFDTHDLDVKHNVAIIDVALRGYYPSTAPSYTVTITDHAGQETAYTISPSGSNDIRGHHVGTRVMASSRARVKVESSTSNEDEVHGFSLEFVRV